MRILVALILLPLCGCAELSAEATPQNVSAGLSFLDHAICMEVGHNGLCAKKEQKIVKQGIGVIDTLPPAQ